MLKLVFNFFDWIFVIVFCTGLFIFRNSIIIMAFALAIHFILLEFGIVFKTIVEIAIIFSVLTGLVSTMLYLQEIDFNKDNFR